MLHRIAAVGAMALSTLGAMALSTLGAVALAAVAGCRTRSGVVDEVDRSLQRRSRDLTRGHEATFSSILERAITEDRYACLPHPDRVFGETAPLGARLVRSRLPHYGFFHGPVRYGIKREGSGWKVDLFVLVTSELGGEMELAECRPPASNARGDCRGVEYPDAPSTEVCPSSGRFRAPRDRESIEVLVARWSREVEEYYNRDAARFGLPVVYDFEFRLAGSDRAMPRVDVELPLLPTCGRTPYFVALRSGWSTPIVAHEMGHFLGLFDEYEMLSGIVAAYPKAPYPGAEISRMGLSMKRSTVLLPLHHYLILRRYFCPEPAEDDPYGFVLQPP